MMDAKRATVSVLALTLALGLAACQTTGSMSKAPSENSRIAGAMADAAKDAAGSGRLSESLAINEKLYHDNPNNPERVLAYARDLRRMGRIGDAKLVIRTPALSKNASEPMLTEAALVMIGDGNYDEAVTFAEKAIAKNASAADAHQAMALALSGNGRHKEAEEAFARALALWPEGRNQTAVINNLAMSQAAQGKIKEARATMAMATGEALRSKVYQNNRAFLASLDDADPSVKMQNEPIAFETVPVEEEKLSGSVLAMKPVQKPVTETSEPRAPKPQPEIVAQAEPAPVMAVEKQEIALAKKEIKKETAEKPEAISPAAGSVTATSAVRPTPLFDPEPEGGKNAANKPWWKMGFTPNDNSAKRSGLNK